jgi:hypothetical protein
VANNPTEALKSTATEALTEATGVDINQVAGMADNPTAAAEGMLSSAIPPALRGYVGKNKDQIIESLQAEIYQQKGLSRFSPPAQRRSAEAEARSQAADILSQLSKFPQGNGLAGQIAGTLSAAAQGAAEVVASGSSDVGANRDAVLARVQAEVYAQRGIAPGTTGFKKTMADKIVEQRVKQLLGN